MAAAANGGCMTSITLSVFEFFVNWIVTTFFSLFLSFLKFFLCTFFSIQFKFVCMYKVEFRVKELFYLFLKSTKIELFCSEYYCQLLFREKELPSLLNYFICVTLWSIFLFLQNIFFLFSKLSSSFFSKKFWRVRKVHNNTKKFIVDSRHKELKTITTTTRRRTSKEVQER